jgi:hypothetical protein
MRRLAPLLVAACALLGSCMTLRPQALATLDADQVITHQPPLPPVSFDGDRSPDWPGGTRALFQRAFVEVREGPAQGDLHIQLRFEVEQRREMLTTCWILLTTLSLYLLPLYAHSDVTLWARVEGPGRRPKEYCYREPLDFWAHAVLLPVGLWQWELEPEARVHENMLLHFLVDLRKDLGS